MSQNGQASFLFGNNSAFITELYGKYLENPGGIDPSWAQFFAGLHDDPAAVEAEISGPSWQRNQLRIIQNGKDAAVAVNGTGAAAVAAPVDPGQTRRATLDSLRALMLIRAHRVRGHLLANLDPLHLQQVPPHPELEPYSYGFSDADWDRPIFIDNVLGFETATLREILQRVRATYCDNIGVEYMHIQNPDQKAWIQERIEGIHNQTEFTVRGKQAILERLTAAETFEHFLDKRFTGTKRFGLDGGETLIPALEQILKRGSQLGLKEVVIGMAHRGRLNVLANFMGKRFAAIFSEFQGTPANPEDVQGSGDVKYHLGTSSDREFDGNVVHLSLTANPSHLEAVDPVALGKVRAKLAQRGDKSGDQVMGLILHGDAAFAGQGLVAETLELSALQGYQTGGTIHFVINNQIGFTTSPFKSRSGQYCTEVGKIIHAPIFHVNGDDPEAAVHVARIAVEYRQRFKKDVVVDMFCYRRHGHNEADEPAFTQPLMYRKIASHPTTRQIYATKLVNEGVLTPAESDKMVNDFMAHLDAEFEAAKTYRPNKADWLEGAWSGLAVAPNDDRKGDTAVPIETLQEIGRALTTIPEGFNANRKIVRQLQEKAKMFETGTGFDWATAEALAFGSLALEGFFVRMSGQDCARGTFSHRHAVLVDQETEAPYIPLNNIREGQGAFEIIDSPLSEAGVLGFDYGYSLAEPKALVLWEAQFGDFANGAQVIVDQFIASAEAKWLRMSGLVMLLPHGFEGQGPEHSSARLERYLQLCAEDNIQVCNISTPANYFHVLRRQLHRSFRKPLIIVTPKSLLRAKLSTLAEMGPGTSFHRVIAESETLVADKKIRRVVLCTGKLYHELLAARTERKIDDIALVRVEQLYPLPTNALSKELSRYPNAEVVWCQEEPENAGAWNFIDRRLEKLLGGLNMKAKRPRYVGRPEAAAAATGSMKRHVAEQAAVIAGALAPA
jgi:2-oxoglutarate dehydrogenase E1 component